MTSQISAQRRQEIATNVGVHEQYLYQCLTGRRDMRPSEACRIERETGGELTRRMLCQSKWRENWPELAANELAQAKEVANA